jgi:enoyl-CoA hydratase/carnithine racemase
MGEHGPVRWSEERRAFVVRLDRPPANAFGTPMVEGLDAALDAFDRSDARTLIVASALPGFFVAGADIKQMVGAPPEEFAGYGTALRGPIERIAGHDRPSIAVIEGRALGGGLELALATTLRIGTEGALLGLPEAKIGLLPGAGGTQRLPRLVGRGRALDIMLRAREVSAEEALRIGLLDAVAPDGAVLETALAWSDELAARSPAALAAILRCVDDADDRPLTEGLANEAKRVNALFEGPEAREGLSAFVEKRSPNYG